jgi:hypothetical protein
VVSFVVVDHHPCIHNDKAVAVSLHVLGRSAPSLAPTTSAALHPILCLFFTAQPLRMIGEPH